MFSHFAVEDALEMWHQHGRIKWFKWSHISNRSLSFILRSFICATLLLHPSFSLGCDDWAVHPSGLTMPISNDEPICPKFQPNIFDPSRCHECLRQKHLHTGAGVSAAEEAPQPKPNKETGIGAKTGAVTGIGSVLLTPIASQAEERDTSSKVREKRGRWTE